MSRKKSLYHPMSVAHSRKLEEEVKVEVEKTEPENDTSIVEASIIEELDIVEPRDDSEGDSQDSE